MSQSFSGPVRDKRALLARLALLPIPALLFAALLLQRGEPAWIFEPPYLVLTLNVAFSTVAGLLVAYLAARSYIKNGSVALLLMGCAMLVYGIACAASAVLIGLRLFNPAIGVHNIGVLVAAFMSFLSALGAVVPAASAAPARSRLWLLCALYLGAAAFLIIIIASSTRPDFPLFATVDGGTHLRTVVLSAAIVQFALCAVLLGAVYRRSRSAFLYWYALGLALLAAGLMVVALTTRVGGAVSWLGRSGQYLAGLYFVASVVAAYRERVPGEEPLGRALRDSRERYATLVSLAVEGVLVRDFAAGALDGRFLEANAAVCGMLGYTPGEMRRLSPRDIFAPEDVDKASANVDALEPDGFLLHEKTLVRKDGRRIRAEISSSRIDDSRGGRVISVIRDVTDRRLAESFSRAMNDMHSAIHSTRDIAEIMNAALARAADAVGCDTAAVSLRENGRWVVAYVHGFPADVVGSATSDDDEPHALLAVKTGLPVAVDNASTDDRVNREYMAKWAIRSVLVVPLIARGEPLGVMSFNYHKAACAFGKTHLDFACALASALSMALYNSRLFSEVAAELSRRMVAQNALERSLRRFELLAATAGDLLQSDEPQAIVNALCSKVMEHLDCHAFFNFLVDDKTGRLRLNACAGVPTEDAARIQWLDFGAAVCGCVARDGARIVTEHIPTTPDPRTDLVRSYGINAYACYPLLGPAGKVMGTLSFGTKSRETFSDDDLSLMEAVADHVAVAIARMNADRDLRENEERLRLATEVGGIGTWYHDLSTGRSAFCERARGMFGLEGADPFPFDSTLRNIHPDDRADVQRCLSQAFSSPGEREHEYRLVAHDGSIRWVMVRCRTMPDGEGQPSVNIGVVIDVTARKEHERRLEAAGIELEKRVAERTAETRRLAGQLRALAAQLAQVEQLERKRLAKMLHDHIQQLLVAARMRLDGLPTAGGRVASVAREVDGILAEALAASRSLTIELSPPVLHEAGLNGGLGWLAAWMSQKHGFTVNFTSDGRAEPLREEMRFLLFECVRELLLNAVKHSGVREASVTIERRDEDTLRIVVQDKGRGFDPAALAARGPADATFGLFSIQQRLAHFSGDVRIDSAPGKGVRVTLAAPLLHPEGQEQAPEPAGAAAAAPPPVNGKIRVLVVDDHTVVRQGIVGLLRAQKDIEVVGQAGNGREAVEAAEKLRPNIVIMDVNMPVMSGIEATKLLRARIPGTKVIGLSLYADAGIAAGMRDAGAVDYLTKDGPAENLIAAIRAHGKP